MAYTRLLSAILLGAVGCTSTPLDAGARADGGSQPVDYSMSPCWGEPGMTTIYSGETHELADISAICRAEGERTRLYVTDELWETKVTQAAVNAFMYRFERPNLGVLATNEEVFGELPVAAFPDGKLPVFVIDTEGAGEGYLCGWCAQSELHLDGNLLDPLDGDHAMAIAAHESLHAIHRAYDPEEEIWVDETLAQAAMIVNGFVTDQDWVDAYLTTPNVDWGPGGASFQYGAGLLFGTYLWEQDGPDLLAAITQQPAHGWEGLDAALQSVGQTQSAWELFLDMAVAIYVGEPSRGFGIRSFEVGKPRALGGITAGDTINGRVAPYGLAYYEYGQSTLVRLGPVGSGTVRGLAAAKDGSFVVAVGNGENVDVPSGVEGFVVFSATAATDFELSAE